MACLNPERFDEIRRREYWNRLERGHQAPVYLEPEITWAGDEADGTTSDLYYPDRDNQTEDASRW